MKKPLALSFLAGALGAALSASAPLAGCDPHEPSRATVINELPAEGNEAFTVDKVWYRSTLFFRPIAPGQSSETLAVGFGDEPAYLVLSMGDPPRRFLAQTNEVLVLDRGEQMRIPINRDRIRSQCVGTRLGPGEWDFIKERIFPGDQVEPYDAPCPIAPPPDAGSDATTD